jgi:Outer membrane protein/protective antigen OMA87
VESRGALAPASGARIASLVIITDGPHLPGPAERVAGLHSTSRESTIRRQLLFAPGDTVDTLLVGETMRRLRRQRLYSDAVLLAQRCDPSGPVGLVLRTRDAWTLRPTARLRGGNALSVGVEEKNLFGTGRMLAVTSEMSTWGTGAGITFVDPWLFGRDVEGSARLATLGGAHTLRLGLRNHEYSVFDRWRAEASVSRLSFADTGGVERSLYALRGGMLVGRRVGSGTDIVTTLLAGAEFDSAAAISPSRRMAPDASPTTPHVRSFLGADVGLLRRTARYDTASWVVPGRGFLDVPLGWEADGVLGAGYERDARAPALKLDAWMGRVWIPARGRIVTLDAWASGYAGHNVDANHIARLSTGWYQQASRGMWAARLTGERLLEVDPDIRALSLLPLTDYTIPAVRPYALRGGTNVAGSLERAVHLFPVGAASVVDAGAFVAGSYRWQVNGVPDGRLGAGVAGARFRLLSANGAVSSVRVDVGAPFALSDVLRRRPFVVLSIGTLFDVSRQRDGRR